MGRRQTGVLGVLTGVALLATFVPAEAQGQGGQQSGIAQRVSSLEQTVEALRAVVAELASRTGASRQVIHAVIDPQAPGDEVFVVQEPWGRSFLHYARIASPLITMSDPPAVQLLGDAYESHTYGRPLPGSKLMLTAPEGYQIPGFTYLREGEALVLYKGVFEYANETRYFLKTLPSGLMEVDLIVIK